MRIQRRRSACKHRFCSSTVFVHIEQKWLATATEIVVLTKMVAISTDFVHFGQKWLVMSMWSAASTTFVRFGINLDNDKMLHKTQRMYLIAKTESLSSVVIVTLLVFVVFVQTSTTL